MKKYLKKILALTLILSLCTTTMLSGTLAKYTSEVSGTATVTAAQFKLDSGNLNDGAAITLSDATGNIYASGATLFPGSEGFFAIDVNLISDVDAAITADVTASITPTYGTGTVSTTLGTVTANSTTLDATALRFYVLVTNSTDTTVYDEVSDVSEATSVAVYKYSELATAIDTALTANHNASAGIETDIVVYVAYIWEFEATNLTSTTSDPNSYLVTSTITATDGDGTTVLEDTESTVASGTPYYSYNSKNYANLSSIYDILDTAWGNAITNDIASHLAANDTSTEGTYDDNVAPMTGYDIVFDIAVTATQLKEAIAES